MLRVNTKARSTKATGLPLLSVCLSVSSDPRPLLVLPQWLAPFWPPSACYWLLTNERHAVSGIVPVLTMAQPADSVPTVPSNSFRFIQEQLEYPPPLMPSAITVPTAAPGDALSPGHDRPLPFLAPPRLVNGPNKRHYPCLRGWGQKNGRR